MYKRSFLAILLIVSTLFSLISCNDSNKDDDFKNVSGEEEIQKGEESSDDTSKKEEQNSSDDENVENSDKTEPPSDDDKESADKDETPKIPAVVGDFVYSVNSKKYHLPTCYHAVYMKEDVKMVFVGSSEELARKGFEPCKMCMPELTYDPDSSEEEDDEQEEFYDCKYVLNTDSMKFHLPDCSSAINMKEENRTLTNEDRGELIMRGYSPCGKCKP